MGRQETEGVCVCVRAHMLGEMGVQPRKGERSVRLHLTCKKNVKKRNVRRERAKPDGEVVTSSFDLKVGEGKRRGW